MLKNFVNINLDRINLNFNLNSMFIKGINNILVRENLLYTKVFIKNKRILIKIINAFKFIQTSKETLVSRYSFFL